jgi:circadian clock protein KaiC
VISDKGIKLMEPYIGLGTVLTGSARVAQEARERAEALAADQTVVHERALLEARLAALQAELMARQEELKRLDSSAAQRAKTLANGQTELSRLRGGNSS